jgi:hypothetical protein
MFGMIMGRSVESGTVLEFQDRDIEPVELIKLIV